MTARMPTNCDIELEFNDCDEYFCVNELGLGNNRQNTGQGAPKK